MSGAGISGLLKEGTKHLTYVAADAARCVCSRALAD